MARDCSRTSVGLTPLAALGTNQYGGRTGGLYGGGHNRPTAEHLSLGRSIAALIEPLDAAGAPYQNGVIGLALIGASSSRRIATELLNTVLPEPENAHLNPRVKTLNLCKDGLSAESLADPDNPYWSTTLPGMLATLGVAREQVQAAWLQVGRRGDGTAWPDHVDFLEVDLRAALQQLKVFFPNLRLCYLSSTHYHGYSDATPALEPNAYEQAFAVQAVCRRQALGAADLQCNPWSDAQAVAPWIGWGPDLWCNGSSGDGSELVLECPVDVMPDGYHLTAPGGAKLARRLRDHLVTGTTSRGWFLEQAPGAGVPSQPGLTGVLAP